MRKISNPYTTLPDGTLKHINPLTGTEVWTVPSRAHRPLYNQTLKPPQPLSNPAVENYCDFCQSEYFRTPPEKARLTRTSEGRTQTLERIHPDLIDASPALFRRVANLFEIVTIDYWMKNHGFHLSPSQSRWKETYLGNPRGLEHTLRLVEAKLMRSGKTTEQISNMAMDEKIKLADAFFGGTHDLIIAGGHFKPGAARDNDLLSSGELTPEDHYRLMRFTIDAMTDIYLQNPYVRYVAVFQNWLQPAGASFDHLHKQLVGLDEWGPSLQGEADIVRKNPNVYNKSIVNFSSRHNLIFAENDFAIALSDIGRPYPTLAIYSKSRHTRPEEHTEEAIKGFSDLVHACHAAMGSQIPCNEEWSYSPRGSEIAMPWRVLIKWRTINPAGFEGGTGIHINPISPAVLRGQIVPRLIALREQKKIGKIRIAGECRLDPNPLLYGQKSG